MNAVIPAAEISKYCCLWFDLCISTPPTQHSLLVVIQVKWQSRIRGCLKFKLCIKPLQSFLHHEYCQFRAKRRLMKNVPLWHYKLLMLRPLVLPYYKHCFFMHLNMVVALPLSANCFFLSVFVFFLQSFCIICKRRLMKNVPLWHYKLLMLRPLVLPYYKHCFFYAFEYGCGPTPLGKLLFPFCFFFIICNCN